MAFDIEGARKEGYSDAEIADYLGQNNKFDVAGARKEGYADHEIISHLSGTSAQPSKPQANTAIPQPQAASQDDWADKLGLRKLFGTDGPADDTMYQGTPNDPSLYNPDEKVGYTGGEWWKRVVAPAPALAVDRTMEGLSGVVRASAESKFTPLHYLDEYGKATTGFSVADKAKEFGDYWKHRAEATEKEYDLSDDPTNSSIRSGLTSVAQMAIPLAPATRAANARSAAMVLKGESLEKAFEAAAKYAGNITLGTLSATTGGEAYNKYRDEKGFSPEMAAVGGGVEAAIEYGTEKLGMGPMFKYLTNAGKRGVVSFLTTLGKMGVGEQIGEQLATLGQSMTEKIMGTPGMSEEERIQGVRNYFESVGPDGKTEFMRNAKDTAISTATMTAVTGGLLPLGKAALRGPKPANAPNSTAAPVDLNQQQPTAIPTAPADEDRLAALQEQRANTAIPVQQESAIPTASYNDASLGDVIPESPQTVAVAQDHDMLGGAAPAQTAIPTSRASAPAQNISSLVGDRRGLHTPADAAIDLGTGDVVEGNPYPSYAPQNQAIPTGTGQEVVTPAAPVTTEQAIPARPPTLNTQPTADMYNLPDTQSANIPTGNAPSADSQVLSEQIANADFTAGNGTITLNRPATPDVQQPAAPEATTAKQPWELTAPEFKKRYGIPGSWRYKLVDGDITQEEFDALKAHYQGKPNATPEEALAAILKSVGSTTQQEAAPETKYELPAKWTATDTANGKEYRNSIGDKAARKKDGTWNVYDSLGGTPDNVATLDEAFEILADNEEITLKERVSTEAPKKPEGTPDAAKPDTEAVASAEPMVHRFSGMLTKAMESGKPIDRMQVYQALASMMGLKHKEVMDGINSQEIDLKGVEEQMERAVVQLARNIMSKEGVSFSDKLAEIERLYSMQPNLSHRTGDSKALQQYSTPAPIAAVLADHLGMASAESVYEPTAGNGMLAIGANPEAVTANEIDSRRNESLKEQGFNKVLNADAMEDITAVRDKSQAVVVMNPPFGVADNSLTIDGVELTQREHIIAAQALDKMTNNGRAGIIIGGHNFEKGKMTGADWTFFNWLYNNYNVEHNVNVDGKLYGRQGTTYPIRVITINGRKTGKNEEIYIPQQLSDKRTAEAGITDEVVKTFDALRSALKSKKDAGEAKDETQGDVRDRVSGAGEQAKQDEAAAVGGTDESTRKLPGRNSGSEQHGTGTDTGGLDTVSEERGDVSGRQPARSPEPVQRGGDQVVEPGRHSGQNDVRAGDRGGVDDFDAAWEAEANKRKAAKQQENVDKITKRKPAAKPKTERTAKEAATAAQDSAADAIKQAGAAIAEILRNASNPNKLNSGFTFDDATYQKIKPLMQGAWAKAKESASNANEALSKFISDMMDAVGDMADQFKPYIKQFYKDVTAPAENKQEEKKEEQPKEAVETELQATYPQRSKGGSTGKLAPRNLARLMNTALENLEEEVGDIDKYVQEKLGYESSKDLFHAMSGEQIDAVALAIASIDKGQGVIIGDQTGVGKGRIASAIMLYAKRLGLKPIFVTEKPKLYSDIHRDMTDIMESHPEDVMRPYISGDDTTANVVDGDNNVVHEYHNGQRNTPKGNRKIGAVVKQDERYQKVIDNPEQALKDFDYVAITYNQLQGSTGVQRREMITKLAEGNVLIMDEAHNAAGDSGVGEFFKSIMPVAKGVTYLSATYAKRPGAMALYSRTELGNAGMSQEELEEAITSGGVPMQQIIASLLAESGQYIRRENDYNEMERPVISMDTTPKNTKDLEDKMDATTDVLRDIVEFSAAFGRWVKNDVSAAVNGSVTRKQDRSGVSSSNFSSTVHNYIRQLALSLKVDGMVSEAVAALEKGEKPLFYVDNTMEKFLSEFANESGIAKGDDIDVNFGNVMHRALDNLMTYTIKKPSGAKEKVKASYEDMPSSLQYLYDGIADKIGEYNIDVTASPLDALSFRLKQAYKEKTGKDINIGEITGRTSMVDMSGPIHKYATRQETSRNDIVNGFNGNGTGTKYDVVIFNQAGATGLSLHPTEKTGDKRPRKMFIVQPSLNVDSYLQALGRIFRTGQLSKPQYVMALLNLPSETRPAIIQNRKLASINANLSAKAEGVFTMDVPDMDNSYGDQVVDQYLRDHADIAHILDIAASADDGADSGTAGAFNKFSGRLALLPVAKQKEIWADIIAAYNSHIDFVNEMGENKLIAKDFDFKAKTTKTDTLQEKTGEGVFQGAATLETVEAKVLKKPYKFAKVEQIIAENLDGKDAVAYSDGIHREFRQAAGKYVQEQQQEMIPVTANMTEKEAAEAEQQNAPYQTRIAKARENLKTISEIMDEMVVGEVYTMSLNGDDGGRTTVTLLDINYKPGTNGSPIAPSKLSYTFAVAGPQQRITIPATKSGILLGAIVRGHDRATLAQAWDNLTPDANTETQHIITGNLLAGMKKAGDHGQIIYYTNEAGERKPGVLVKKSKAAQEWLNSITARITLSASRFKEIVGRSTKLEGPVTAETGLSSVITFDKYYNRYRLSVIGKNEGAKIYSDEGLKKLSVAGRFDAGRGNSSAFQHAYFEAHNIAAVIDRMNAIFGGNLQFSMSKNDAGIQETPAPAFSTAKEGAGKGVARAILDKAVSTMESMFPSVPVKVVETVADLPFKAPANVRGAYHEGRVYLVRSNIQDSLSAVTSVLAHEFTHHGIMNLGKRGQQLLNQIALAHTDQIKKIMKDKGWKDTAENRIKAADELLAEHGETKLKPNWWQKVKEFFRSIFQQVTGKPVSNSVLDQAIKEIRELAQANTEYVGNLQAAPVFSQNSVDNTIQDGMMESSDNEHPGAKYEDLSKPTAEDARSFARILEASRRSINAARNQAGGTTAEIIKRESAALKQWAIDNSAHYDDADFSREWRKQQDAEPHGVFNGVEQRVIYKTADGKKYAVKSKQLLGDETWSTYLNRLEWHNAAFPDTFYQLQGFSTLPSGGLTAQTMQPFVQRKPLLDGNGKQVIKNGKLQYVEATEEQIRDYMESKGYRSFPNKKLGELGKKFVFLHWIKGDIVVSDLHGGNVWIDVNNKIRVFDPHIDKATAADHMAFAEQSEIEDAVRIPLEDGAMFSLAPADSPTMKERAMSALNKAYDAVFDSASRMGQQFMAARYMTKGAIEKANMAAHDIYDELAKFREDKQTSSEIWEYLTTKDADASMIGNEAARGPAERAKSAIMDMGRALVDAGLMKEETLEKREGEYLPRLYLKHLLGEANFTAMTAGGKKMDLSYLKKRNDDLDPQVRDFLLGEIKDPAYLVYMALSRPSRDIALNSWMAHIAAVPEWTMPKMLLDWNISENPTYQIGRNLEYTVDENGVYHVKQRVIKHDKVVHEGVDLPFIATNIGPDTAKYVQKHATEEWQKIGQVKFRIGKNGLDVVVTTKTVQERFDAVNDAGLDKLVGARRAGWMRTGQITSGNSSRPVKSKDGLQVTPFWLAKESARLSNMAKSMDPQDAVTTLAIAKRANDMAHAAAEEAGYALDDNGELANAKLPDGWRQVPNTARYGRLRGTIVRAPIYNDIVGEGGRPPKDINFAEKILGNHNDALLMQMHKWFKISKTTMNLPTHAANFGSNAMLVHMNTNMSTVEVVKYVGLAAQSLHNKDKFYRFGQEMGFTAASFSNAELGRINTELLDYLATEGATHSPTRQLRQLQSIVGKLVNKAGDIYQLNEILFKTAIMRYEFEVNKKSKTEAAMLAHTALFDYSDVSAMVRTIRQHYLGLPFLTFTLKASEQVVRQFIKETKNIKAAKEMPGSAKDKLLAAWVGTNFTRKLVSWNALLAAAPLVVASFLGIDWDDWEKIKEALPAFYKDKGHVMLMPHKDGDGRLQFMDLSRMMPWDPMMSTARAAAKGDVRGVMNRTGILGGAIPNLISVMATGVDPFTRRPIVDKREQPTAAETAGAYLGYFYNLAAPSMLSATQGVGKKVIGAVTGKVNSKTGEQIASTPEAAVSMLGANTETINIEKSRLFGLEQRKRAMTGLQAEKRIALSDRNNTPEDRMKIIKNYDVKIQRAQEELAEYQKDTSYKRTF